MKYIVKDLDKIYNSFEKYKGKIYVGIIGTRFANEEYYEYIKNKFLNVLDELKIDINNVILVSGGAKGVDKLGEKLAEDFNLTIIVIIPDYKKYVPKTAPLERNKAIAYLSDILIAFPNKYQQYSGTKHCMNEYKKLNKTKLFEFPLEIENF